MIPPRSWPEPSGYHDDEQNDLSLPVVVASAPEAAGSARSIAPPVKSYAEHLDFPASLSLSGLDLSVGTLPVGGSNTKKRRARTRWWRRKAKSGAAAASHSGNDQAQAAQEPLIPLLHVMLPAAPDDVVSSPALGASRTAATTDKVNSSSKLSADSAVEVSNALPRSHYSEDLSFPPAPSLLAGHTEDLSFPQAPISQSDRTANLVLTKAQLVAFYEKHDQAKIFTIDQFMGQFSDDVIIETLIDKYGESPIGFPVEEQVVGTQGQGAHARGGSTKDMRGARYQAEAGRGNEGAVEAFANAQGGSGMPYADI
jgi:hypothetical protein